MASTVPANTHDNWVQYASKPRKPSRWLRKTKMCVYHSQNNCSLGSNCLFAHSPGELHNGPDLYKTQICSDFMNGQCINADCTFAHGVVEMRPFPTLKQKLCKWHRKGRCRNGENCGFAHGLQDLHVDTGIQDVNVSPAAVQAPESMGCMPWPPQPSWPLQPLGSFSQPSNAHAPQHLVLPVILQSSLPMPAAFTPQEMVPVAFYYANIDANMNCQSAPLCSQAAPYISLAAGLHETLMKSDHQENQDMIRDDISTSAETAGYLSD